MPVKPIPTPKDSTIDALSQQIAMRRSDLSKGQQASLASILSHRARSFGIPGCDALVTPLPIHRQK